jgi:hypothetical protein
MAKNLGFPVHNPACATRNEKNEKFDLGMQTLKEACF